MTITLKTSDGTKIPLKTVIINVNIYNHIAQFEINQQYHNTEKKPNEIFYTFPTPTGASVFDFSAKIDNRLIKAILKEKTWAREDYNKAISDGDGAFLMERVDGDIFTVSLGNVQPNAKLEIIIKYVVELNTEIDASQLRLNIPLTIMPKYKSIYNTTSESLLKNQLSNPQKSKKKPYNLSICGTVNMIDGIKSMDSKTCKMKISDMIGTSLQFEINDLEKLNKDIIILIKRNTPKSSCLMQNGSQLQLTDDLFKYATMVNIVPDFEKVSNVNPADVHYVIMLDRSGSMEGDNLKYCKSGAQNFLTELPIGSSFDVYQFNDCFSKFRSSDSFNPIQEANAWINNINSDGGTELKEALTDVYNTIKQTGKRGVILLLIDGGISDTEQVLKLAQLNRNVNVFTIGIGQSVSSNLIQGLADASNGKAEFINDGSDQIKEKIVAQLKRSHTSFLKSHKNNNIQINVDGQYKSVPENIPIMYENDINTFFIFSEAKIKSIVYTQTFDDDFTSVNIPIYTIDNNNNYPLHRMAGIKIIDDLANKPNGSQITYQKKDPYKIEIISTSLNLGILSNYTAFIGVEVRNDSNKTLQDCVLREIPLQIPKHNKNNMRKANEKSKANNGTRHNKYLPSNNNNKSLPSKGNNKSLSSKELNVDIISNEYSISKSRLMSSSKSVLPNKQDFIQKKSHANNKSFKSLKKSSNKSSDESSSESSDESSSESSSESSNSPDNSSDGELSGDKQYSCFPIGGLINNISSNDILPNDISPNDNSLDRYVSPNDNSINKYALLEEQYKTNNLCSIMLLINAIDLPNYIMHQNVLIASNIGYFPFADKLKIGDYVVIVGFTNITYNGTYKICNIGSTTQKWIIEKQNI